MAFKQRNITMTIPAGATSVESSVGMGATFGRVIGFRAKNVTDTTTILQLKDGRGRVFYLDAAAKDYATAAINRVIVYDDTLTGLNFTPTDATGAALTAADAAHAGPIVKGPITVTWSSGTALDTIVLELYVEV